MVLPGMLHVHVHVVVGVQSDVRVVVEGLARGRALAV